MDELFSTVIEAMAAAASKKANVPSGASADPRYAQMLADLQAKNEAKAIQPSVLAPAAPVAAAAPPAIARTKETAHDKEEAHAALRSSGPLSGLFEDGNSLLKAVVAAELLGPPTALRGNQLWQISRPNERST